MVQDCWIGVPKSYLTQVPLLLYHFSFCSCCSCYFCCCCFCYGCFCCSYYCCCCCCCCCCFHLVRLVKINLHDVAPHAEGVASNRLGRAARPCWGWRVKREKLSTPACEGARRCVTQAAYVGPLHRPQRQVLCMYCCSSAAYNNAWIVQQGLVVYTTSRVNCVGIE